mgnify:FL=1
MNPAAEKMWGYEAQMLKGKSFLDIISPLDRSLARQMFATARHDAVSVCFETNMVVATGVSSDAEWSAFWSASDKTLFCVVHDITERKRAEMILRKNENRMRTII